MKVQPLSKVNLYSLAVFFVVWNTNVRGNVPPEALIEFEIRSLEINVIVLRPIEGPAG